MEVLNRKVNYDYEITETFEAGIALKGTEIKSIRNGNANLKDSYARIKNDELFLINMHIAIYKEGNQFNHDETRERKLLMHKQEIKRLHIKVKKDGYSVVPIKLYFKKNKAKILLGLARGKKNYDKRAAMKERDLKRDVAKEMKN